MKRPRTTDRVAAFIGPIDLKRFAVAAGRMRYSRLKQSRMNVWRQQYLVDAFCEIPTCGATGDAGALVFDHCHRHGWARAVLCYRHNAQLAHLEAAWLEYGLDLSGTPYERILAGCLDCTPGGPGPTFVRDRAVPRYEQLANDLRAKIHSGELTPGSKLPATSELRKQYGVSETVIRYALYALRMEGLTEGQQGKGVYVKAELPPP